MRQLYIFIFLLPIFLHANSFLTSKVPLPKTKVQNLDPYTCEEECLKEYLEKGFIFSFLAHTDLDLKDETLKEQREKYLSLFNMEHLIKKAQLRIALLLPYKKIARYAASTTNASFAYMMSKNRPFELKSYTIEDEDPKEISQALQKIQEDGFKYIIAPFTQEGEKVISKLDPKINIFFPTINKKDSHSNSKYFYYGGID